MGPVAEALRARSGKLLILRLTPRGSWRPRLDTTLSSRISASTALCNAFLSSGRNSDKSGKFAADHPDCVHQGESVGIFSILEGRFVHESPDGKMRHHQSDRKS